MRRTSIGDSRGGRELEGCKGRACLCREGDVGNLPTVVFLEVVAAQAREGATKNKPTRIRQTNNNRLQCQRLRKSYEESNRAKRRAPHPVMAPLLSHWNERPFRRRPTDSTKASRN